MSISQDDALRELRSNLLHIEEQAEKNQWWNVISVINRTQQIAIQRFDTVLKEGN